MRWLAAVIVSLAGLGEACPDFQCQDLNQDVCAKRDRGVVLLNSLGCKAETNCSLSELLTWESSNTQEETFPCSSINPESVVQRKNGKYGYHCGIRMTGHDLANGEHPKQCKSDKDCALQDGTFSVCSCSFSSTKFCAPPWDSSVFDDFWRVCEATNSRLYDFGEYYYWLLTKETYVYQQAPLPCASALFTEFYSLARLSAPAAHAAVLLLPFLFLFY